MIQLLETLYLRLVNTSFQDVLDCEYWNLSVSKLNNITIDQYNLCCLIKTKIIKEKDRDKPCISNTFKSVTNKKTTSFVFIQTR